MKYKDYCLLLGAEQNRDRALLGAARATSAPIAQMLANGAVNAHRYADVLLQGNPSLVDSALRAVERYRQRTGTLPCCVVPLNEVTVATGLAIAQQFGLKYLTADTVRWARNKNLMKQQFAAHALPFPRHALVETAADLVSVARQIGFPLVIKPTNGGGSMGVQLVRNQCELENAFRQLEETARQMQLNYGLPRLPFQVEEYIDAPYEVSVEVLNTPQNRVVFAVTDKFLGALPYFVELGHSVPSHWRHNGQITLTALNACKALGIHRGVAHVEMKIRANGEPVLIEVNARPAGDNIMDLVERVTGLNLFEFHVRSYVDDSGFNRNMTLSGRASIAFLKAPPGRILKVRPPAIDELPPEVVALNIWSREGAVSGPCIDSDSRDGSVELFWADADGVAADAHMDIARRLSEQCFTVQRETSKLLPVEYSGFNG